MKIKQVEELVGITKKNIRFYEEQGPFESRTGRKRISVNIIRKMLQPASED